MKAKRKIQPPSNCKGERESKSKALLLLCHHQTGPLIALAKSENAMAYSEAATIFTVHKTRTLERCNPTKARPFQDNSVGFAVDYFSDQRDVQR